MISRQTTIAFFIKSETCTAINGREVHVISRRGHMDPAKARDLAVSRGAIDGSEVHVKFYVIEKGRSHGTAKYIVNARGDAKPVAVAL